MTQFVRRGSRKAIYDSWTSWPKPPWRIIVIHILYYFSFSVFCVVRYFRLSLLNNFYCDILHLYNIVIPIINLVTSINLKKAGIWPAEIFLWKNNTRRSDQLCSCFWFFNLMRGSGRVFSGFGIWPKYGVGIGKMINILTGSGIWLFPGNRDSPKIGHGMRDLCLRVCRECRKPSRPTGSSGQSELTRRALSGVSFQTKHPMECLVNRS